MISKISQLISNVTLNLSFQYFFTGCHKQFMLILIKTTNLLKKHQMYISLNGKIKKNQ